MQALITEPESALPVAHGQVYVERGHHLRLERRVGPVPDDVATSLDPASPDLRELFRDGLRLSFGESAQAAIVVGESPRRHLVWLALPAPVEAAFFAGTFS